MGRWYGMALLVVVVACSGSTATSQPSAPSAASSAPATVSAAPAAAPPRASASTAAAAAEPAEAPDDTAPLADEEVRALVAATAGLSPSAPVEEVLLLGLQHQRTSEVHHGHSYVTYVITRSDPHVEVPMLMVPQLSGFLYVGSVHHEVVHERGPDWTRGSSAERLWQTTASSPGAVAALKKALAAQLAKLPNLQDKSGTGFYSEVEAIRYLTPKAMCVERFSTFGGSLVFVTSEVELRALAAPVATKLAQYVDRPTMARFRHDIFAALELSPQRLAEIDALPLHEPVKLVDEEGPRLSGTVDVLKDAVPCLGRHRGEVVLQGVVTVDRHRAALAEYANLGADAAKTLVTSNGSPVDYQLFEKASPRLSDVLISPSATMVVAIVAKTIVVVDVAKRDAVFRVPVPTVEAVVMAEWAAGAAVSSWRRKALAGSVPSASL